MGDVVVALDTSLSMPMTGVWSSAHQDAVTMIAQLVAPDSPGHLRAVIAFGEIARSIDPSEVATLEWDHTHRSHLAGGLNQALDALDGQTGRVVVFTDLEPTAHDRDDGEPLFAYPPSPETIAATLAAISRYAKADVTLLVRRYTPAERPDRGRRLAGDVIAQVEQAVVDAGGSVEVVIIP